MQPRPTLRAAREDDLAAVTEICAAEETAVRGETQWTAEALAEWWRLVEHERDAFVAVSPRPCAVGVLLRRGDFFDGFGAVSPDMWGRGLGGALLGRLETRAREVGAARLHHDAYAENVRGRELLERRGFRVARRFLTMELDLAGPPRPPQWPAGVTVSTFAPDDARAFHATLTEAFADEWHFVPSSFEEWTAARLGAPETDTSLWFLARAGGEAAAALRCDAPRGGAGWIGAVGVRPRLRGRGIARALLLHAFAELRRRGFRRVRLGVDVGNPTGATRLYERVGMRVQHEDLVYGKELS